MTRPRNFLSLVKIGIVGSNALTAMAGFALALRWTATRQAAAAAAHFPWELGALVLAGTALLVGGACAVNNWMDRDIDARMERTKGRPTARGAIGAPAALGIGAGLGLAGLGSLLAASPASAILGLAGALVYLVAYSGWSKRRGAWSSFVGGVAGAVPPLIGWAAADPLLGAPAWALFAFLIAWQQAHVRALALRRAADYLAAGLPMSGLADRRPRAALLGWAAAVLPFPLLVLALDQASRGRLVLSPAGIFAAIASSAIGLAWVGAGIAGFRSRAWPERMFFSSLAYLVLVFGLLFAAGI